MLPDGTVGLLAVKSPSITAGYWHDERLTNTFKLNGYWLTGDVARRDREGNFYHLDRTVDVIDTLTGPVYSLPIEEVLLADCGDLVHDCSVIGIPAPDGGQTPIAVVRLQAGTGDWTAETILEQANKELSGAGLAALAAVVVADRPGRLPARADRQGSQARTAHPAREPARPVGDPSVARTATVGLRLVEPDWRRLPGWRDVTPAQWRSAQWQRAHCVQNPRQLRAVVGDLLADDVLRRPGRPTSARYATMPTLITPQMLNTMRDARHAFYEDPVRRYMLPVASDRHAQWPSHPFAQRDSLHEAEMWAVEGLTHRYPTKVLVELVTTCPQYCGHCTRMDLVGTSTPQVAKARFTLAPANRQELMLDYLKRTPTVRDVVVSGGDVANVPWPRLETFLRQLLDLDSIRDIRLATKARRRAAAALAAAGRPRGRGPGGRARPAAGREPRRAHPRQHRPRRSPRWSPRRPGRCSTPASATCATRACCCVA